METKTYDQNVERKLLCAAMLELLACYDEYRIDKNIVVSGKLTNQLVGDMNQVFKVRSWYTADYMEELSDDEQDGVDFMLDGFDKLGDVTGDDKNIMMEFDFLIPSDALLNIYNELIDPATNFEKFMSRNCDISVKNISAECSYVEIIAEQMKTISTNNK